MSITKNLYSQRIPFHYTFGHERIPFVLQRIPLIRPNYQQRHCTSDRFDKLEDLLSVGMFC